MGRIERISRGMPRPALQALRTPARDVDAVRARKAPSRRSTPSDVEERIALPPPTDILDDEEGSGSRDHRDDPRDDERDDERDEGRERPSTSGMLWLESVARSLEHRRTVQGTHRETPVLGSRVSLGLFDVDSRLSTTLALETDEGEVIEIESTASPNESGALLVRDEGRS